MPFCHLIQYCKSKPLTIITKTQKVTANTAGINYKIGIQVPKRINNEINLDKNNYDHLWILLQFAVEV
jgi:transcriptional regulatory protein LevR